MEPAETFRKSFGRRLRFYRKRAGLTGPELAKRLKMHKNTVYGLEDGAQWLGSEVLEKICAILEIEPGLLFTDKALILEPNPREALIVLIKALKINL